MMVWSCEIFVHKCIKNFRHRHNLVDHYYSCLIKIISSNKFDKFTLNVNLEIPAFGSGFDFNLFRSPLDFVNGIHHLEDGSTVVRVGRVATDGVGFASAVRGTS